MRALLERQSVACASVRTVATPNGAQDKVEALAELRGRHSSAVVRFVDDDADSLRAVARDPRLLSLKLFYAAWGYHTPDQQSSVRAMPRVRQLESSRDLERVLSMPRKDGTRIRL